MKLTFSNDTTETGDTSAPTTQWPHHKSLRIDHGTEGGFALLLEPSNPGVIGKAAFFTSASDMILHMLVMFGPETQAEVYAVLDLTCLPDAEWPTGEAQTREDAADQEADWPPQPDMGASSLLDQIEAAHRLLTDAGYSVRRDPPKPEFITMGGPGPEPIRPKKRGASEANTQAVVAGRVSAIGKAMAASDYPTAAFED